MKRFLIIAVSLILLFSVSCGKEEAMPVKKDVPPYLFTVEEEPGKGVLYASITAYQGEEKKLTLPDSLTLDGEDYKLGHICIEAFLFNQTVTELTLPETLLSVEDGAFAGMEKLEKVISKAENLTVKTEAFVDCEKLEKAVFAVGTVFSEKAFSGCTSLKEFEMDAGKAAKGMFFGCVSLEKVTLKEGVTEICENAFGGCSSLKTLIVPASVTSVADFGAPDGLNVQCPEGSVMEEYCKLNNISYSVI